MRIYGWMAGAACVWAQAAHAGSAPVYAAPAGWVEVASLTASAAKAKGPLVIFDQQIHVDGATVTTYSDVAMRAATPQDLTQLGRISLPWLPDKGDLVIHRVELLRNDAVIDLLKDNKFEVIRREQQLEQRSLNGMLTATMQMAGAQIGDVVRISFSVTVADPALRGNVQAVAVLPSSPVQPAVGRLVIGWSGTRPIHVTAGPRLPLPAARAVGGMQQLTMPLPLPKVPEMPGDSPPRYRATARAQVTSFADWQDVSKTMSPLFATTGTIAKDGPIAAEVARIAAASPDPLARMAAALQLVQDRIGYFANGMNGGNYVPQSPAATWTARSGDCKAKTLLLLALLRELGIEAEPLLVNASMGDGLPESAPMPAAFNHVIVHAKSGGRDYWLDGTNAGARLSSIADVPPFHWGLPLRPEGAGLLAMPATAPAIPQYVTTIRLDESYGIDMPVLFELRQEMSGPGGAPVQDLANLPTGEERDKAIDAFAGRWFNDPSVFERSVTYDAATGVGTVIAKGMINSTWDRTAKRAVFAPGLPGAGMTFAPDRGRAAWQAIPVTLDGPGNSHTVYTVDLPDHGDGATLEGGKYDGAGTGWTVHRTAAIAGPRLTVVEDYAAAGGELPASAIPAERAKVAALTNALVRVRAGVTARRSWDTRTAQDRKALQPLEAAYARLIALHPDEATRYVGRASFRSGIADYAGALKDLDAAIALDADADTLTTRSQVYLNLGDPVHAIADLRKAQEIDPNPSRIAQLAEAMGRYGKPAEALVLVDPIVDSAGDARLGVTSVRADLLAELGRKDEGAQAFDALLAERPGDGDTLNAVCFYRATWNVAPETGLTQCNQALQSTNWSPGVLDSRAFVNLRLGKLDAALADATAAYERNPAQKETLLLRGVIKRKAGDAAGGAADIAEALRRAPLLGPLYKLYGVLP